MKRKFFFPLNVLILLFLLAANFQDSKTQDKWKFGNNFMFDQIRTDTRSMTRESSKYIVSDTILYQAQFNFSIFPYSIPNDKSGTIFTYRLSTTDDRKIEPKSPLILGVKLNPNLSDFYTADIKSNSKSYSCYIINDSSDAILIGMGITSNNVNEYQYHVVENDSFEIIQWAPIPKMEQNYGATRPYAFLGKYNAPGKQILVEVVNKRDFSIRDGVIFDWRVNFKPIVNQIIAYTPRDYFNITYKQLNRNYATEFDTISGIPHNLKFPVDSINSFRIYFKSHPTIPYVIFLKKEKNDSFETNQIAYWILDDYYDFDCKYFESPGKYELIIQRAQSLNYFEENQILRIPFKVVALIEEKYAAKLVFIYSFLAFLIILLAFSGYYIYNKQKQYRIVRQNEIMELKLKSIRAQLNPHFMFNALNSIQNLVNKNDKEAANHYLTKFASLTRKVLNTSEKELISLDDEITLLDDYLLMEQLRFGFDYKIKTGEKLNMTNIEIPAMLLQPYVENAVKHGISLLQGKGQIEVGFEREETDLVLSVTDNGMGFKKKENESENTGLGLKLNRDRIALLNSIFITQRISLKIESDLTGTNVKVRLGKWL